MSKSKIEWTDRTWNPVTGCDKVSQGCKFCYAERHAKRFWGERKFTDVVCHHERLDQPFAWKKPAMVFVNSMSDLFHEDVQFQFIIDVLHVIEKNPQHTFQVLTKRPARAKELFCDYAPNPYYGNDIPKNLWIGVSIEDQKTANERIPYLLQIPAAVRFVSYEPALGPVDFERIDGDAVEHPEYCMINALTGEHTDMGRPCRDVEKLDWVICGGESGPKARPMHPDWARSVRDQCQEAGVPFFFKQWGEWLPFEEDAQPPFYYPSSNPKYQFDGHGMNFTDPETAEPGRFMGYRWMDGMDAVTLCIETKSANCSFLRVGKKKAGRKIDGREWNEMPGKETQP